MVHESKHQQAVIKWSQQSSIRSKWPELALLHHIKNETREGAKQIAIDKAIGVKKGVPDLSLPVPRGRYGSNSIELSPSSASRLELVANASGGFSGGSIGGTVELIGLSAPTASNSAANKQYVDEHAGARVATGSYVGTGDYNSGTGWGSSNPTSLTFDFAPKLLIIGWQETLDSGFFTSNLGDTSNNYYSIYTGALTTQFKQYRGFGDPDSSYAKKSSDGKTITWYSTHHANSQRNDKRRKYYYLAIG